MVMILHNQDLIPPKNILCISFIIKSCIKKEPVKWHHFCIVQGNATMPNIEEYKTKHYLYIGDVFNNCKKYCAERFSFAKNYILIVL